MRLYTKLVLALSLLLGSLPAGAEIGLLLDAKPNVHLEFGNELTGAGHSGVYLSNVCIVSPVELRLCQPGEMGTVIQNYEDFKEDEKYQWNAVPLSVYLYGVDNPAQRPLFGSPELRAALQEQYRHEYLQSICTTERCIGDLRADWRESVAAAFVREIYIFAVDTTREQDENFIREFNARANVNHYSGFTNNCADFAKLVVNTYFPHSTRRDALNDLGMTGPKAIARSFTHYAEHHPELDLRVIRIDQLPGTYRRSSDSHTGTEQVIRAKKWLLPVAAVSYQAIPVLAASYFLTGRFSPDKELSRHPSEEAALLTDQLAAKQHGDKPQRKQLEVELRQERLRQVGGDEDWNRLRQRFNEVVQSAIADGVIANKHELRELFRELQARGKVSVDGNEQAWMDVESAGQLRRVGLSASNVVGADSDRLLAMQLLLARMEYLLSTNAKHRELYTEIQGDWDLLQRAEQSMPARGTQTIATRR